MIVFFLGVPTHKTGNQAISVNKVKINDHEQTISAEQFIRGQWMIVENGNKNKYLIEVK